MSPIRPRSASVAAVCSAKPCAVPLRIMVAVLKSFLRNVTWLAIRPVSDCKVFTVTGKPLSSASTVSLLPPPNSPPAALTWVASLNAMIVLVPSSAVTCIRSPLRAVMTPFSTGPATGTAALTTMFGSDGAASWAETLADTGMTAMASRNGATRFF